MASFDSRAGQTFDADLGTFDGPEIDSISLAGQGIGSVEAFGLGEFTIYVEAPPAIVSAEAFGTPEAQLGLEPTGIVSAEAFGTPEVGFRIDPVGIISGEVFGVAEFTLHVEGGGSGINSAEAFGVPEFQLGLKPSSIASAEAFGLTEFFRQWKPAEELDTVWVPDLSQDVVWNEASELNTSWGKQPPL
jgi:hypothetical protein